MIYEQRPHESAKAFQAFREYCEMGPDRSIRDVARKLSKSSTIIKRWSATHSWQERVAAYDTHILKLASSAEEKKLQHSAGIWAERIQRDREATWKIAQALIEKAEKMLQFPLAQTASKDGKTVVQPAKWTFADMARIYDIATKLARLSLGLPTDHTEHTGPDNGPILTQAPQVHFHLPENGRETKKGGAS